MSTTFEKVREVVASRLSINDLSKIKEESSFIDDLGADSLDIVELVMQLEEEFGVDIPDDEADKITTIGDAVNYIEKHKGNK